MLHLSYFVYGVSDDCSCNFLLKFPFPSSVPVPSKDLCCKVYLEFSYSTLINLFQLTPFFYGS